MIASTMPAASRTSASRSATQQKLTVDPVVGKDVLELLSSAMYADPRAIYREYVQNAADAIDEAYAAGVLVGEAAGRIDLTIDAVGRTVVIRDNGIGIRAADIEQTLTALGASRKRGTQARGFRGVGRLAAFGYAQAVSFRAKFRGESISTEVTWDCRALKTRLADPTYRGDLRDLVKDVVSLTQHPEKDSTSHFFEVRLDRVVRTKHDVLMDSEAITSYIAETVPAPFHRDFPFANEIESAIAPYVAPPSFQIRINGSSAAISRPYRQNIAVSRGKTDQFDSVEIHTLSGDDGNPQAILWIAHHSYLGALHGAPDIRGVRARVRGIQVGDEGVFALNFPESRFNSWSIAEVHIIDPKILPNGRRDGFEQTERYSDLINRLVPFFRSIATRCRATSSARARMKAFDRHEQRAWALLAALRRRDITARQHALARNRLRAALDECDRIARFSGLSDSQKTRLRRRYSALSNESKARSKQPVQKDRLAKASKVERAAYDSVFDLILELTEPKVGTSLIDKLEQRLAKTMLARHKPKRRAK